MSDKTPEPWPHRFVVVEGPIGVGKTTLARKIAATVGAESVLEQADENPFLERFYKDPRAGAFPTQLFFLFQRARQLQELRQQDMFAPVRVSDSMLERIARRGIRYEKHIEPPYLEKLIDAYTRYFHQYSASPLLIVNAATIDPVSDSRDFEELFEAIRRTQRGRHYFNPLKD